MCVFLDIFFFFFLQLSNYQPCKETYWVSDFTCDWSQLLFKNLAVLQSHKQETAGLTWLSWENWPMMLSCWVGVCTCHQFTASKMLMKSKFRPASPSKNLQHWSAISSYLWSIADQLIIIGFLVYFRHILLMAIKTKTETQCILKNLV